MKSNHQHINQDSGDVEYYTPIEIVNAARTVMGSIDLDPASSPIANERVKAVKFFSSNGLGQDWFGNVWMNHPFDRFENPKWIAKIVSEFNRGHIKQACCITFASTTFRAQYTLFLLCYSNKFPTSCDPSKLLSRDR